MITPEDRRRRGDTRGRTRVAWVIADQGVNSVSNVVGTVVVAAAAPGRVFAVFATGQLILALAQTVMLSAAGDRLLQSAPDAQPARYAAAARFFRRTSIVTGAMLVLAVVDGRIAAYVTAVAVAVVVCSLDHVRVALVTAGQVRGAFATDAVFAVVQIGGLVGWSSIGTPGGAAGAWAVWGGAALVALAPYALGLRRVFPRHRPERVRDAVSLRYGVEMLAVNGSGQLAQLAASTTIGLSLNAMIRGSQIGFGVVVLALVAARTLLIPVFARPDSRRVLVGALLGVGVLCPATGALTWLAASVPGLRFLVAGQHLGLGFVALATAVYLAFGIQQLGFYWLRARRDDSAVGVSRVVVIVGFALTATLAVVSRSADVFLAASASTWAAAAGVMLWRHRRTPSEGVGPTAVGSLPVAPAVAA